MLTMQQERMSTYQKILWTCKQHHNNRIFFLTITLRKVAILTFYLTGVWELGRENSGNILHFWRSWPNRTSGNCTVFPHYGLVKSISQLPKQDLFRLCFGLFRETKNYKFRFVSVCFGVSNLYRSNWNKQNCFETNRNNPKLMKNTKICSLSNCFGWLLFVSVPSKHRNSLFLYRTETTETNVLFRIVPQLVSVVSNRNYFQRSP